MLKKFGAILFLSIFFTISLAQNSEGLGQLAGKMIYTLEPGESKTLQWGMVNEKDEAITVYLSITGEGSELMSFPESVLLPPNKTTYVDVTVTVPTDHPNDVYFAPKLTAIEPSQSDEIVRISMAIRPQLEIIIGNPLIREVPAQQEQEKVSETVPKESPQSEKTESPGSFTINPATEEGGGCLISTATFGSELAPQVQLLREIRDNKLLSTGSGSAFMTGFNTLYYSFSPTIADWERQSPIFREAVQIAITPLITSLSILNYVDIDSETKVLGYGISLILLNVGMYFVAPVVLITKLRR